ncbi:hypothetical protein ABIE78_006808 [Sinorhizobium fredii]|uniref:Uncharacterized protein n=1 Tax=Sinorhizobium fredii (strain USDA 257) TaxID=1185652 RepID=I3XCG2_SINF2|nr:MULTISPECIES: hypothetical protein [Sinorhizobium]AFL53568.1 hypothetical protein USDA257_c50410 [Sinorhizobium fredii USDA 257]PDT79915.1 hypothetical protein CO676_30640 [Sinorhizobium sp. BJ1]
MYAINDFYSLPLRPEDVTLLQGILDEELEARHITIDSEKADTIARRLIELFQSGVRDEDALRYVIKAK